MEEGEVMEHGAVVEEGEVMEHGAVVERQGHAAVTGRVAAPPEGNPQGIAVAHERRGVSAPASGAGPGRTRVRGRCAGDAGMATAEYAIATVAAAGFAGLLILVLRSDEMRALLAGIVRGALSV